MTTKYFVKGLFFNVFEKVFNSNKETNFKNLSGYQLIEHFKKRDMTTSYVGLYKTKDGDKVIIRKLDYKFKNLLYEQIINEASMLNLAERYINKPQMKLKIKFPKLCYFKDKDGEIVLVREYLEGRQLKDYNPNFKLFVLSQCLRAFKDLSKKIKREEIKKLPKRTPLQLFFRFPVYFMKVVLKEPLCLIPYLKLAAIFYKQYMSLNVIHPQYVIAHHDVHSKNVLVNKKTIHIIDMEISAYAEKETDIAFIARNYTTEVGLPRVLEFLERNLKTNQEKSNFLRISIFYTFQLMANEFKTYSWYVEAKDYLRNLSEIIEPRLFSKNRLHNQNNPTFFSKKFVEATYEKAS